MTQVNPNIIQEQKIQGPSLGAKAKAALAPAVEKKHKTDRIESGSPSNATSATKGKSVIHDPLANVPAGKEQAGDGGQYYPPVGMPGVYYAMQALLLDLKAGLSIAHIDNEVMVKQYKAWAEALDTFTAKSKKLYDEQANEALWSGIASAASTFGSALSIIGSGANLISSEAEFKALSAKKAGLNSLRFDKDISGLKQIKAPIGTDEEAKLVLNQVDNSTEMKDMSASLPKDESIGMEVSEEQLRGVRSRLEDLDPDWKPSDTESLSVQRQEILREKTLVQKAQEEVPESDSAKLKTYDDRRDILNGRLKTIEAVDKGYAEDIKVIEQKIADKKQKSEQLGQMFYNVGNFAGASQGVISGFSKAAITKAQGQADKDKNMADKLKSLKQMVTQAYEQQVNREYQTIDQLLSSIEGAISKLYAAQQSGAA